jgi:hypothetical protein
VKNSIQQIAENFIINLQEYFSGDREIRIDKLEDELLEKAKNCAAEVTAAYVELLDRSMLSDKQGRKKEKYAVVRKNDRRRIQTKIGEISFRRTYYRNSGTHEYAYLADQAIGLEAYTHISNGLGLALVEAAKDMSYQKACEQVYNGSLSRETVMHKIRQSNVGTQPGAAVKRHVTNLHVDADEAHVTLVGGHKSIVPLISVYEGIENQGKRGKCREIFHISEYGKKSDEIWEEALTRIENKYDLSGTKIYLHGDGGSWIQTGLNWLPNATFVLDKYHKNKAIKTMTAGLDKSTRKAFNKEIRSALAEEDTRFFDEIAQSIVIQQPDRSKKIIDAANYLKTFAHGISICEHDEEANNGGATEPHVSHMLAGRLSSRPMKWSKATLEKFAPILVSDSSISIENNQNSVIESDLRLKAVRAARTAFRRGKTAGLPWPDSIGALPVLNAGKTSTLYKALKGLS